MKTIILVIISLVISLSGFAQDATLKTSTLNVKGNCEECKKRIENAADIKGVKVSNWDENKQTLTVTYKSDKVTLEQIEKAIAASGHDVADLKGNEANYKKLPECCKYRDKACEKK
ncbi:ATPase [Sphingobacteriaceae bacterium]|nr:ATPase [Sphingobacteriaceae bacterium]